MEGDCLGIMKRGVHELSRQFLHKEYDSLSPREQHVIRLISQRLHVSRYVVTELEESLSFGQRMADRVDATHDYEVNLKAELEIMALHQKIDALREHQWEELIVMQKEQIRLLTLLIEGLKVVKLEG